MKLIGVLTIKLLLIGMSSCSSLNQSFHGNVCVGRCDLVKPARVPILRPPPSQCRLNTVTGPRCDLEDTLHIDTSSLSIDNENLKGLFDLNGDIEGISKGTFDPTTVTRSTFKVGVTIPNLKFSGNYNISDGIWNNQTMSGNGPFTMSASNVSAVLTGKLTYRRRPTPVILSVDDIKLDMNVDNGTVSADSFWITTIITTWTRAMNGSGNNSNEINWNHGGDGVSENMEYQVNSLLRGCRHTDLQRVAQRCRRRQVE